MVGPARSLEEHLEAAPLSRRQWLVWLLATAGKLFEGLIVFMGGIALPLQAVQFSMTPLEQGCVVAASLLGILIGALSLGGLADRFGRRTLFIAEMLVLLLGLLLAGFSPSAPWLLAALLLIGLALGADYPTAHLMIAESIPAAVRGRLVLSAFSAQAVGAVLGTALATLLLSSQPDLPLPIWRWFYGLPAVPVAAVAAARLLVPESSHWLLSRGQHAAAERELARLLNRPGLILAAPAPPTADTPVAGSDPADWRQLLQTPLRRATVLASVPWFLQDVATYGVGIFTPLLLQADLLPPDLPPGDLLHADLLAARSSLLVDLALLPGIAAAIALVDRWGRIPLQILGFIGCAAGLLLAASGQLLAGLLLFQFMTNLGPNAQTYLLAGELFPTPVRGLGAGFAAAAGKLGAVVTALALPLLLRRWGVPLVLPGLAITSLLGAAVTWCWRVEPMGRDLAAGTSTGPQA